MAEFLRRRTSYLMAAEEASPGVAETLDPLTDAIVTTNLLPPSVAEENIPTEEDRGVLDTGQTIIGRLPWNWTFACYMRGSGTAGTAPDYGLLLRACGMVETIDPGVSVTYEYSSDTPPSLTLSAHLRSGATGLQYIGVYSRGNVQFQLTAGGLWMANFTFTSRFSSVADAAWPASIVIPSSQPVAWKGGVCTIGGTARAASEITLESNNEIVVPQDPNDQESIGAIEIVNRDRQGNLTAPVDLVANWDLMTVLRAETSQALVATNGTVAGNIVTINGDMKFLSESLNDQNRLAYRGVPFQMVGEDAAGFSLVYT